MSFFFKKYVLTILVVAAADSPQMMWLIWNSYGTSNNIKGKIKTVARKITIYCQ